MDNGHDQTYSYIRTQKYSEKLRLKNIQRLSLPHLDHRKINRTLDIDSRRWFADQVIWMCLFYRMQLLPFGILPLLYRICRSSCLSKTTAGTNVVLIKVQSIKYCWVWSVDDCCHRFGRKSLCPRSSENRLARPSVMREILCPVWVEWIPHYGLDFFQILTVFDSCFTLFLHL